MFDTLPMVQIPNLERHDLVAILSASDFAGAAFGDPYVGESIWLVVWHEQGSDIWRFKIMADDTVVGSGETNRPEVVAAELERISERSVSWYWEALTRYP